MAWLRLVSQLLQSFWVCKVTWLFCHVILDHVAATCCGLNGYCSVTFLFRKAWDAVYCLGLFSYLAFTRGELDYRGNDNEIKLIIVLLYEGFYYSEISRDVL